MMIKIFQDNEWLTLKGTHSMKLNIENLFLENEHLSFDCWKKIYEQNIQTKISFTINGFFNDIEIAVNLQNWSLSGVQKKCYLTFDDNNVFVGFFVIEEFEIKQNFAEEYHYLAKLISIGKIDFFNYVLTSLS